ncbi:hypothetical protein VNI00_012654 [Paramarasmius palmivorus]|uniref:Thiol methyltransferase 1 n=1 Tax=Paramarasmius palmivorus TaxID=297713 RepID=A0AAW0C4T0_9AGAR
MSTEVKTTAYADPIRQRLRDMVDGQGHNSWDNVWKESVTPWDHGETQPPLKQVILSKELNLPATGRALVPGCGRGYDAIFLASATGFDTLGLDISPTALQNAKSIVPEGLKNIQFKNANFFELELPDEEKFNIIYDYTFFVAIPPSMRNDWGKQMRHLVKPGGYLITLVYPITPYTEGGPPYHVQPDHYYEPLGQGWEKVIDRVPDCSAPVRPYEGDERLVVWKRLA